MSEFERRLNATDGAMLTPLVRGCLGDDTAQVIDWAWRPLHGGATKEIGFSYGVYRFQGTAQLEHERVPWSLVLKAVGPLSEGSDDPAEWNYWQREPLVYSSGLLEDLADGLAAPRCFGVLEPSPQEAWIWLEDVAETGGASWPLARYGLAARHLGAFNGAYLAGRPLPQAPWLTKGRIRNWLRLTEGVLANLPELCHHPLARRWLSESQVARVRRLWQQRGTLLEALERLPRCLCHHDAFRRNLLSREGEDGVMKTVAVDWSITGTGAVGEEIATMVAVSLQFLEVDMTDAAELEATVFACYLEGLREAGWRGDPRLVRLGFTAAAGLFMGVCAVGAVVPMLVDDQRREALETIVGHPLDRILEQFAQLQDYALGLGDEARGLLGVA